MDYLGLISNVVGVLGACYGIFSFFYYRKIKFYMFVSKFFKFTKTTEITLSYRYIGKSDINFNSIKELLKKENYTVMNANTNNIIINMNDFIIQFKKDDFPTDEYGENSFVRMTLTRTYYKQAKKAIDEFINICEDFNKRNLNNEGTYNLKIIYNNIKNPYLSASTHRIKEEDIKTMILHVDTAFLIDDLNEEVIINKNSLSYTSKSSKNIYKIANDFMIV
ncbi:hypothetical protein [Staphylococcus agnetis]|uniref:hypothetical protein n=1 Tax=Staphylococcus agnetis TaxID=985762 RepID=UPI001FB42383|nr:hypothetical protein [Staphylococcus agnetis]UOC12380.1 hypothetical protein K2V63_07465 [Staphylococcus agnetis]